jgi:hypothetical protein
MDGLREALSCGKQNPHQYTAPIGATWQYWQSDARLPVCISANKFAGNLHNEAIWPELYEWFAGMIALLDERLGPRLAGELVRRASE